MTVSDNMLRTFRLGDIKNRGRVIDAVRAAGFTIENIQEVDREPETWGLVLKPRPTLAELFHLDREVLLWCSAHPRFQARDIESIRSTMTKMGVRLSRSFAILVTAYDKDQRNLNEGEALLDTTIVHCELRELEKPSDREAIPSLRRILLTELYTRDLYDLPGATMRAADFFGRRKIVDNVCDELVSGDSQVGIFGLRKIGKTSLLNRIADVIASGGRCVIARVDLQWTTSIDPRPEYTLWAIGEALYASGRAAKRARDLRLFGQFASASDALASEMSVWEAFSHDLTLLIRGTSRRILIALDEIERMYEVPAETGFVRFWRLLRGFDQQFPGRVRFLLSGTSPECAERAVVDNQDNPLFQYLSIRYLGPLGAEDAATLLRGLGEPIGLRWEQSAIDLALRQTGGHPALLRAVGSLVHTAHLPRGNRIAIDHAACSVATQKVLTSKNAILAQIVASLADQYRDEFVMLEMLATGQIFNFRQLADAYPDELSHLIGYGLLPNGTQSGELSIALLQAYIQTRPNARSAPVLGGHLATVGERIGTRKVVSLLKSGGYADVFLGEGELGERVAIKMFRGAQLSSLEREVEYLRNLDHPGIVRFIESTRSGSGHPCLIMEYLEGGTLAEMCNAASAPTTGGLLAIASDILKALSYMHPDPKATEHLGASSELTAEEFSEWQRRRHGVVHRDIKPENILMTSRGSVLIDFNIAVRAAAPVLTMTSTPGYLPDDFDRMSWTPDIDVYQLGVTLAQIGAGIQFDGENLADMLVVCRQRHGPEVGQFIETLLRERPTATAALGRLGALKRSPVWRAR